MNMNYEQRKTERQNIRLIMDILVTVETIRIKGENIRRNGVREIDEQDQEQERSFKIKTDFGTLGSKCVRQPSQS